MSKKVLNDLIYLYICVPIIIFLLGWCKLYIAIPIVALMIFSIVARFKIQDFKSIKLDKKEFGITVLIAAIYTFISGISGYVFQNWDHIFRNAVLEELVNNAWPIYHGPSSNFSFDTIFVYYFAHWLPASVFGKLFGLEFGYFMLYVWSLLGIILVFECIKKYFNGKFYIPLIIFIFFSGLDILEGLLYGENIVQLIFNSEHLEWFTGYQMSSFTTQMFWVFNQAIPAWCITFFILQEEDNRYLGPVMAMGLLFCTLPAVGLIFLFVYKVFFETLLEDKNRDVKKWIKNTFSWQNIILGVPLLLACVMFVTSNSCNQKVVFEINLINAYILYLHEILIYYVIVYRYIENKSLYWLSLMLLLICPAVKIGEGQDFCMRASIPSLIVMFIFVLQTLSYTYKNRDKEIDRKVFKILVAVLIIGAFTPINEINRTFKNTKFSNNRVESIDLLNCSKSYSENYFGDKNKSLFVKYIAK